MTTDPRAPDTLRPDADADELRRAAEQLADSAQAWLDHIDPDEGDENEPHWRDQLAVARAYLALASAQPAARPVSAEQWQKVEEAARWGEQDWNESPTSAIGPFHAGYLSGYKSAVDSFSQSAPPDAHWHCANGCEKAVAVKRDGHLVCVKCGGDWVPCTPEVCPEMAPPAAAGVDPREAYMQGWQDRAAHTPAAERERVEKFVAKCLHRGAAEMASQLNDPTPEGMLGRFDRAIRELADEFLKGE